MNKIEVIFPKTKEEFAKATQLYEAGKAASGEDIHQELEEKEKPAKVKPTPFGKKK